MALLTHNDYLEQASDSGLIGFLSYLGFITCHFWYLYRKPTLKSDLLLLTSFLGVLGWALQSLTEFGLYIPALAWPAFMLLGWLAATGKEFQSTNSRVAA
jgi:O-antigen ligase